MALSSPPRSVRTRPTPPTKMTTGAGVNPKRLFTLLIESKEEGLPMEDRVLCCVSRLEMTPRHRSYVIADGNLFAVTLLNRCNRSGRDRRRISTTSSAPTLLCHSRALARSLARAHSLHDAHHASNPCDHGIPTPSLGFTN